MDIQALIRAAQAAGVGVGPPGTMGPGDQRDYPGRVWPDRGPGNGPPGQQLMGDYLQAQGSMPPPQGGNPMLAAVQAAMQGGGGGPMPPATGTGPTTLSGPAAMMLPNNINSADGRGMAMGVSGKVGPGGDSEWYDMHDANQAVRGNLPVQPTNDYSGYGDEMSPMDDPRQTPPGKRQAKRSSSGGPQSDEEEIADIQNKMGGVQGPDKKRRYNKPGRDEEDDADLYEGDDRK